MAIRVFFLTALVLSYCGSTPAQQRPTNDACRPIGPERQVGSPGPDLPYCSPQKPEGYEVNRLYMSDAAERAKKDGSSVIVIARLGTGEQTRNFNRNRLGEVRAYLEQVINAEVVTAEAERVDGFGRLEIYGLSGLVGYG